ncbi:MAG: MBL fold metallo-hydrolase [Rhodospirillales bacterium]|nr:MBL fold metallo-hydrolase [Rhodospirillales bacterium]
MELRFWGVRGSIASPGASTQGIGGNTTCVSIRHEDYLFIFDAGTGLRLLGEHLLAQKAAPWRGSIFLTHYHWDHIQGLPFFTPAFIKGNAFELYGESKDGLDVRQILNNQMLAPYFPVPLDLQQGLITFKGIESGERVEPAPGFTVQAGSLLHPNKAIGFRLESKTASVTVITDHEHPAEHLDPVVVEFSRGTDVLIHDSQYTPEEKLGPRKGWGHSSWEDAARTAKEADVGVLYISHHDPKRSDADVMEILAKARSIFPRTEVATETTVVDLASCRR